MARARSRQAERADVQLGRFAADGTIPIELSGRRVAVEGGIPTETARIAVSGRGNRWHGDVVAVLEGAPERVTPRCPVVATCGGCEWQHLTHEGQLKHKAAIVRRLLASRRLPTRIDAVVPMPDPWHYRVRAQIALGPVAGFRERRAKRIVRLTTCPVVHPLIDRFLEQTNRLVKLAEIPDFGGTLLLHAQVAGRAEDRALQLTLEGVDGRVITGPEEIRDVAERLGALRGVQSVAWLDADGVAHPVVGDLFAVIEVGDTLYTLPSGSFFQSNIQLLPALLRHVRELADLNGTETVADLYGGIGLLGLAVADRARQVTVIEIDPLASEGARRAAAARGLTHVDVVAAPAEVAVADLPAVDRVIVDPPRTGLDRRVIDAVVERQVPTIVYVSCNPATFARDAAAFVAAGYTLDRLSLWDFYPQTVHAEVIARLVRPPSIHGT